MVRISVWYRCDRCGKQARFFPDVSGDCCVDLNCSGVLLPLPYVEEELAEHDDWPCRTCGVRLADPPSDYDRLRDFQIEEQRVLDLISEADKHPEAWVVYGRVISSPKGI